MACLLGLSLSPNKFLLGSIVAEKTEVKIEDFNKLHPKLQKEYLD